jgi:hypothetical protein
VFWKRNGKVHVDVAKLFDFQATCRGLLGKVSDRADEDKSIADSDAV